MLVYSVEEGVMYADTQRTVRDVIVSTSAYKFHKITTPEYGECILGSEFFDGDLSNLVRAVSLGQVTPDSEATGLLQVIDTKETYYVTAAGDVHRLHGGTDIHIMGSNAEACGMTALVRGAKLPVEQAMRCMFLVSSLSGGDVVSTKY